MKILISFSSRPQKAESTVLNGFFTLDRAKRTSFWPLKCRAFVQRNLSYLGLTSHIIRSNSFHFRWITSWNMNNPDSEEGAYETMTSKSTGKSVRDREIPSSSKGEEEGTARQSTEAEIWTAAAPMVLEHF